MNKIYNIDCIEGMKQLENNSINLIVTDPPYLINYCRHVKNHKFAQKILNDDNPNLIIDYIKECYRILKDNSNMYMFCSNKTVDFFKQELEKYFKIKNMIIWDKKQQGMGDTSTTFAPRYEIIFLVEKGKTKIKGKRISDIWEFPKVKSKNQLHQNEKPLELIEQCILQHSNKGDLVFDGFMGSATTAAACISTGRFFYGYELDKTYFSIANDRISQLEPQRKIR